MIEYSNIEEEKLPSTASKESEESKEFKESVLWWT